MDSLTSSRFLNPVFQQELEVNAEAQPSSMQLEQQINSCAAAAIGNTQFEESQGKVLQTRGKRKADTMPDFPSKKQEIEYARCAAAAEESVQANPEIEFKQLLNADEFDKLLKILPGIEELRAMVWEGKDFADEKIGELWNDTLDVYGRVRKELNERIINPNKIIFYVTSSDDRLAGIAMASILENEGQKVCELDQLMNFITGTKGIGKSLINKLITLCKSQEVSSIELASTPSAQPFYKHIGFTPLYKYDEVNGDIDYDDEEGDPNLYYRFKLDLADIEQI